MESDEESEGGQDLSEHKPSKPVRQYESKRGRVDDVDDGDVDELFVEGLDDLADNDVARDDVDEVFNNNNNNNKNNNNNNNNNRGHSNRNSESIKRRKIDEVEEISDDDVAAINKDVMDIYGMSLLFTFSFIFFSFFSF